GEEARVEHCRDAADRQDEEEEAEILLQHGCPVTPGLLHMAGGLSHAAASSLSSFPGMTEEKACNDGATCDRPARHHSAWPTASSRTLCSLNRPRSRKPLIRPSCMTAMRSETPMTSSMSLEIISTATPASASPRISA